MQYGALAVDGDGKIISGATGKYSEHGSSGGGYKTRRGKKSDEYPEQPRVTFSASGG